MPDHVRGDSTSEQVPADLPSSRSEARRRPAAQVYQPPARRKAAEAARSSTPDVMPNMPQKEANISVTTPVNNSHLVHRDHQNSRKSVPTSAPKSKAGKKNNAESRNVSGRPQKAKELGKKQRSLRDSDDDRDQTSRVAADGGMMVQAYEVGKQTGGGATEDSVGDGIHFVVQGTDVEREHCEKGEHASGNVVEEQQKAEEGNDYRSSHLLAECPCDLAKEKNGKVVAAGEEACEEQVDSRSVEGPQLVKGGEVFEKQVEAGLSSVESLQHKERSPHRGEGSCQCSEGEELACKEDTETGLSSVSPSQQERSRSKRQGGPFLAGVYIPPGRRAQAEESSSKKLSHPATRASIVSSPDEKDAVQSKAITSEEKDAVHAHTDGSPSPDRQPVAAAASPRSPVSKRKKNTKKGKKGKVEEKSQVSDGPTMTSSSPRLVSDSHAASGKQRGQLLESGTLFGDESKVSLSTREDGLLAHDDAVVAPVSKLLTDECACPDNPCEKSSPKQKQESRAQEVVANDRGLRDGGGDGCVCTEETAAAASEMPPTDKKEKTRRKKKTKGKKTGGKEKASGEKTGSACSSPLQQEKVSTAVPVENGTGRTPANDDDSWERLLDADEDELAQLSAAMSLEDGQALKVVHPSTDLLESVEDVDPRFNADDIVHIVELTCPSDAKHNDLTNALNVIVHNDSYVMKWVNNNNCLVGFASPALASQVLRAFLPGLSAKPLSEANNESRKKASLHLNYLRNAMASRPKPERTAMVARRLVGSALNVRVPVTSEQRQFERQQLQQAREQKQRAAALRESVWDGD